MTDNRRIILNTLVTYGRSLLSLVLGLFSSRWILRALGESDLGLFGVVGSIILCVQLLNIVMSAAVARYFAFAIGESKSLDKGKAIQLLTEWFNAAISIHTLIPILMVCIGYPIGVWVINNWLVIPDGRLPACIWVFRMSLIAAFFSMITVPFLAMYRAQQLIAELTIWEVLRTIITFIGAYCLLLINGDKLIVYATIMSLPLVVITVIQSARAYTQFEYCRIHRSYLFNFAKIKKIFYFGICDLFSSFGCIVRDHGAAFLINKTFGPAVNSAYSIANQLSSQTNTLANAMNGALMPAMTTYEGAGNRDTTMALAHRSCKYCTLLVLLFAIPLYIEAELILKFWLVNPPEYTVLLCRCVLVTAVCFKLGWGYHMIICAKGKVALYQFIVGCVSVLTLPLMYVLVKIYGIIGVGFALIGNASILSLIRVFFAKKIVGTSVLYWGIRVLLPLIIVTISTYVVGILIRELLAPIFLRVCLTTLITFMIMIICTWIVVLENGERQYIASKILRKSK